MFATEVWMAISRSKPADYNLAATFSVGYLLVSVVGIYIYHKATAGSGKIRYRNRQGVSADPDQVGRVAFAYGFIQPLPAQHNHFIAGSCFHLDILHALLCNSILGCFLAHHHEKLHLCFEPGKYV